jgi:hypothetical protein
MTAIKHCAGCKHWTPPRPGNDRGECPRLAQEVGKARIMSHPRQDPVVETAADFGCILHEGVGT